MSGQTFGHRFSTPVHPSLRSTHVSASTALALTPRGARTVLAPSGVNASHELALNLQLQARLTCVRAWTAFSHYTCVTRSPLQRANTTHAPAREEGAAPSLWTLGARFSRATSPPRQPSPTRGGEPLNGSLTPEGEPLKGSRTVCRQAREAFVRPVPPGDERFVPRSLGRRANSNVFRHSAAIRSRQIVPTSRPTSVPAPTRARARNLPPRRGQRAERQP